MNDTAAILTLLDIFESEIKKNSYRKLYDEWGNLAAVVYDEDISSQLKVILIDAFKKIKLDFSISDKKNFPFTKLKVAGKIVLLRQHSDRKQ